MILPVYKGILTNKENRWFVFTKSAVDGKRLPIFLTKDNKDIELEIFPTDNHPIEWLEKQLNKEVDYTLGKKYLPKEILWYAKITEIDKQETWEEIAKTYDGFNNDNSYFSSFLFYLKKNYHPPKRKK